VQARTNKENEGDDNQFEKENSFLGYTRKEFWLGTKREADDGRL
jgi:hypothetical protein